VLWLSVAFLVFLLVGWAFGFVHFTGVHHAPATPRGPVS
jgi:hypothetical protein